MGGRVMAAGVDIVAGLVTAAVATAAVEAVTAAVEAVLVVDGVGPAAGVKVVFSFALVGDSLGDDTAH